MCLSRFHSLMIRQLTEDFPLAAATQTNNICSSMRLNRLGGDPIALDILVETIFCFYNLHTVFASNLAFLKKCASNQGREPALLVLQDAVRDDLMDGFDSTPA